MLFVVVGQTGSSAFGTLPPVPRRALGGNQGWDGNNIRFGHTHRVSCLQMGPLGNQCLVISGSNDKTACLWDTRLHERNGFVRRLKTHDKAIRRLQFDNNKLITGGDEPLIQCFSDLRDGRGGTLLRCDYLEANGELNMISSFSPCNNTDASRVSNAVRCYQISLRIYAWPYR